MHIVATMLPYMLQQSTDPPYIDGEQLIPSYILIVKLAILLVLLVWSEIVAWSWIYFAA